MFQTEVVTHFVCSNILVESHAVYEIMWKNILEVNMPHMTGICYKYALKTCNIYCFPRQQWLQEKCYICTYNASFVPNNMPQWHLGVEGGVHG
jgi:hypothetical protein